VVSVQFLWCVQYSIHCREEPFEPSMIFFGILTFFMWMLLLYMT